MKKKATPELRALSSGEIGLVEEPLRELAAYHNRISEDFPGCFPIVPIAQHLGELAEMIAGGTARVEALFDGDRVIGFGAASFDGAYGEIDYLFVREECRGGGYGAKLLKRMLAFLKENGVTFVDVKVVRENRAKRLYRRSGFQHRTDIMSMRL